MTLKMHHCLSILEILRYICLHLENPDLLSIALTCRGFKPVAAQALWATLPDLSPVVTNFPHDALKMRKRKRCTPFHGVRTVRVYVRFHSSGANASSLLSKGLTRRLTPQDWEYILPYVPMIRSINTSHKVEISDIFYKNMIASFPGERLFPNIRQFYVLNTWFTDSMLAFAQSFLGPQLQTLGVCFTADSTEEIRNSFIESIPASCPSIRTLVLTDHNLQVDPPVISKVVCQCHYLGALTVPDLSEAAFIHVSQLPRLYKLDILENRSLVHFPSLPHPAFPALQNLTIYGVSPTFHIDMHNHITSSQYYHFEGQSNRSTKADEWKQLLAHMGQIKSSGPLEIVFEREDMPQDLDNPDYIITPDTLQPLLALTRLAVLAMSTVFTVDVDDDFVLEVARACPVLECILLGQEWGSLGHSRATLLSYIHLIRHCPRLRAIGLVIDASNTDVLQAYPSEGAGNLIRYEREQDEHFLHFTFHVGSSYIKDPAAVASCLSSLVASGFEYCIRVRTGRICPPDLRLAWALVQEMIPEFVIQKAQDNEGPETCVDEENR